MVRPRECRASSDFDVRQYFTADANYDLPFGRRQDVPLRARVIWRTSSSAAGVSAALSTRTPDSRGRRPRNAFVASYSNNAPAILDRQPLDCAKTQLTKLPRGGVSELHECRAWRASSSRDQWDSTSDRVTICVARDTSMRTWGWPRTFPVYGEKVNLKFRADAFNVLNHPNFEFLRRMYSTDR